MFAAKGPPKDNKRVKVTNSWKRIKIIPRSSILTSLANNEKKQSVKIYPDVLLTVRDNSTIEYFFLLYHKCNGILLDASFEW